MKKADGEGASAGIFGGRTEVIAHLGRRADGAFIRLVAMRAEARFIPAGSC